MASNRRSAKSGASRPSPRMRTATRSASAGRNTYSRPSQAGTPRRVSTVKLGDLDARTAPRARQKKGGGAGKFIALLVTLAVLVGAGVGVYFSNLFAIEQVTVTGVEHLTASEMTALANVPSDTTLLRVDAATIESNVARDAWVESVAVQRVFPNTLNLAVTERTIGATVQVGVDEGKSTELWALSTDGIWLCEIPEQDSAAGQKISQKIYEDAANVFTITDVAYGVTPEVGAQCSDASINNALEIVTNLTTELKDQVKSVSATSTENTTITLQSNVEIAFGEATDVRDKERVCLQIMADHPDQVSYINVRVVKSPTWRTA